MPTVPLKYAPGTQKASQQTEITKAAFTDTDHVRFDDEGRLTTLPAYSLSSITGISGKVRCCYAQRITGTNSGDYYFYGTHSHLYVLKNSVLYNITPLESGAGTTLGTDPLEITDTETDVVVNHTAHGYATGDRISMSGIAGALNGVPAADFNKEHIITYIDANSYSIEVATAPTSTDLTAGGGAVVIKGQIAAGNAVQTTASGFGTGDFGGGLFGAGGTSTTGVQSFPRIWSFDSYGDNTVMCPGDYDTGDGQIIYIWDGDTEVAPSAWTNAPTDCNWITVVNNSPVALCGRTVKMAAPNTAGDPYWSGVAYREKTLERIELAHSCYRRGEKDAVIHHPGGAILLRYVGGVDLWDMSDLDIEEGCASPKSCARITDTLYWRGKSGAIYSYNGSTPTRVENNQNDDWMRDAESIQVQWHSFAYADTEREELYFHFATSGEDEPSDYVVVNFKLASFTLGRMDRTAMQPGKIGGVTYGAYSGDSATEVYQHFTRGASTFDWYAQTADFYIDEGEYAIVLKEVYPDSNQNGDITVDLYGKYIGAQDDAVHLGAYTVSSNTKLLNVTAAVPYLSFRFSGDVAFTMGNWRLNISKRKF